MFLFLHDIDQPQLAVITAMIFQGQQNWRCLITRFQHRLSHLPIIYISDRLADAAEWNARSESITMSHLWFVVIFVIIPSVDFYATRASSECRFIRDCRTRSIELVSLIPGLMVSYASDVLDLDSYGTIRVRRARLKLLCSSCSYHEIRVVTGADEVFCERMPAIRQCSRNIDMRTIKQFFQSASAFVGQQIYLVQCEDVLFHEKSFDATAHTKFLLGDLARSSAVTTTADRVRLDFLSHIVLISASLAKWIELGQFGGDGLHYADSAKVEVVL